MPTFIKLKIPGRPYSTNKELREDTYTWKLVISDLEEFAKYAGHDAEATVHAYLALAEKNERGNFSHMGSLPSREMALATYLSYAVHLPDREKIYPILEAAGINDKKLQGMAKALVNGHTLAISSGMGWCTLQSFMEIWNCEVVETREKEGFGFPIELESEEDVDTVALENASRQEYTKRGIEERIAESIPDPGKVAILFNLKETDESYVFKMLKSAKNVYIQSSFQDPKQIESMGKMFMMIPGKNVYIKTWSDRDKRNLTEHGSYEMLSRKHNIKFI